MTPAILTKEQYEQLPKGTHYCVNYLDNIKDASDEEIEKDSLESLHKMNVDKTSIQGPYLYHHEEEGRILFWYGNKQT